MKTLFIAALAATLNAAPCYRVADIPDRPVGVENPSDLRNGSFVHLPVVRLDSGDFRDKLKWIEDAFENRFCIEFVTEKYMNDTPAQTNLQFRRADTLRPGPRLSAVHVAFSPGVARIEIAAFMGRGDLTYQAYPGIDLRKPLTASPVGGEWKDHPAATVAGLIFTVAAHVDNNLLKAGQLHKQLDKHGNIVFYRLNRESYDCGWFGMGCKQRFYWRLEGFSTQDRQLGDERLQ